ncbi:MAG: LOG family protein [Desulfobulbaceae bacterium]|nr:LOG family protein [Desulfobulbaceae bacterium]
MQRRPLLTNDGYLLVDPSAEPTLDYDLGVPRLGAFMRLENTTDTLRGIISDLSAGNRFRERCCLLGRSGHSQIGLDIQLAEEEPEINTRLHRIDIPIKLYSLNRNIPDTLFAEIKTMADHNRHPTVGRLFIPRGPSLNKAEIEEIISEQHLLLPSAAKVNDDGVINIPLSNINYLLSNTLLSAGQNAQLVLAQSKGGLGLIQYPSYGGLPDKMEPGDFLCGALHISLGPYCALIDRQTNVPGVFHLAARLLDAVRTSGINVPRQIELFNGSDRPVATKDILLSLRLYPADSDTARLAARVLSTNRQEKILREGVDFADATNIFDLDVCESLFDGLSSAPQIRGGYGRVLTRSKCIEIPREMLEDEWHEIAQDRVVFEVARGNITSGDRVGKQISPELRGFVESLELVGGEQNLRKVFVAHEFPSTDTLRGLKRNNVGVFVGKSIWMEKDNQKNGARGTDNSFYNLYFDQSTFESFCDLSSRQKIRFYMIFKEDENHNHVREFYRGLWVTRHGKEQLDNVHTMIAMFGSHVDGTDEVLTEQIHHFLRKMKQIEQMGNRFAICHGSGPGVMKIADDAAAAEGILRVGVGIDSEKIGQKANLNPPAILNFKNSARHMRQNILDRSALFKIYNIGGMGTFEELLIAITNLKLYESLPAPHIFVDPFGLGDKGSHLWKSTIEQLKVATAEKKIGNHTVRLAPAWVPNFCHIVSSYDEVLEVIAGFIADPVAYWENTGIPLESLVQAFGNAERAGVVVPPYVLNGMEKIREAELDS